MDLPGAVLFACTQNAVRSPMAEAILKHFLGHRIYVDSAGARNGSLVDGFAVSVMEELGMDISRHRPKAFDDLDDDSFDIIVSLSPEAHHLALEFTRTMACEVVYWPTLDPSMVEGSRDTRLDAYRTVRDGLLTRILDTFPPSRAPKV